MISTTPRQRAALLATFPELLDYALPAVRLHPRPGTPTPGQSSVGGPLLWPADEPWPTCSELHSIQKKRPMTAQEAADFASRTREHAERTLARLEALGDQAPPQTLARARAALEPVATRGTSGSGSRGTVGWSEDEAPPEPVAMVPVVQLFRSDAGDLPFPDGTDLLQILWCPNNHQGWHGPRPVAVWRDSSAVVEVLDSPPPCSLITYEYYVPHACVAHPEPLVEFPPICTIADLAGGELLGQVPAEFEQRLRRWDAARPEDEGYSDLAHAPGWKIGGWDASWPDAAHQETCTCGAPMRPLLEVDRGEWLGSIWSPHEEPHFPWGEPRRWQDEEPTGVSIGRNGMYWAHACSATIDHPLTHGLD